MDKILKDLFEQERKRVFEPDSAFCDRVLSRLPQAPREPVDWECVMTAGTPLMVCAVILLAAFLSFDLFMPSTPTRGLTQISLESEIPNSNDVLYLYVDGETTPEAVVLEQLISPDTE